MKISVLATMWRRRLLRYFKPAVETARPGVFQSTAEAKEWAREFLGLTNVICARVPCQVDFLESVPGHLVAFNRSGGTDGRSCADISFQLNIDGTWEVAEINLRQTNYTLPRFP